MVLSDSLPFLAKFHYMEFWVTSYTRGGCPLEQLFLKTPAMENKTLCGFLISYMVPTMVGEWVYQIVFQSHVDCLYDILGGWPGVAGNIAQLINQYDKQPIRHPNDIIS